MIPGPPGTPAPPDRPRPQRRPGAAPGPGPGSGCGRLAHLGVLVHRIAEASGVCRRLGLEPGAVEAFAPEGVRVGFVPAGASRIELVEPLDARSTLTRFLNRRGEGVHHVAIEVPDIGAALERARAAGAVLLDAVPRPGMHDTRVAFLHPKSMHGVLVELVEVRGPGTSVNPPASFLTP
jgi:methylmalonyl-CoA/ethylmalonyl-CoA epimerase